MENTEQHAASNQDYLDALLSEQQAADFLGFKVKTLQKWRITGEGPVFMKHGRRSVRYRRRDLIAWIEERLRRSTSDTGEES